MLHNACIAPGAKLLAKDGMLVTTLCLADPTDGFDFDTIIVAPPDYD